MLEAESPSSKRSPSLGVEQKFGCLDDEASSQAR